MSGLLLLLMSVACFPLPTLSLAAPASAALDQALGDSSSSSSHLPGGSGHRPGHQERAGRCPHTHTGASHAECAGTTPSAAVWHACVTERSSAVQAQVAAAAAADKVVAKPVSPTVQCHPHLPRSIPPTPDPIHKLQTPHMPLTSPCCHASCGRSVRR